MHDHRSRKLAAALVEAMGWVHDRLMYCQPDSYDHMVYALGEITFFGARTPDQRVHDQSRPRC